MNTLHLALRMMMRDLRAGELHLLGLAIMVAVACLTSVGFLADRVARGLDREANQLMGGDLLLRADHPWDESYLREAERLGLQQTGTVLFTSMVSTESAAQLAGVKVVGAGYPLRGHIRIAAGANQADVIANRIPGRGEVWLDERLLAALGVAVGDRVGLGRLEFKVGGMLTFESDRGANFFSLLPRAIFNAEDLAGSGLLIQGSRAAWRLHLAGEPDAVAAFERWAKNRLARGETLESIEDARPEVRNALDQAQRFLSLAALLTVILAAVAIGMSARRYMRRHLDACAVMRCLGARQAQLLGLVIGEFMLFGLVAASLGSILGWGVQQGLALILAGLMETVLPSPSPAPFMHGIAVGVVLLIGFVMPQLLRLGRVSTLRVLRREIVLVERRSALAWLAGAAALLALVFWISGELRLGLQVSAGFACALILFAVAAWSVLRLLNRARGGAMLGGSGWRYGIASLVRRAGASVVQIVALAVGMTALLLLTIVRGDLLDDWRAMTPPDAPNRFIINIQPDQREALSAYFGQQGLGEPDIRPMIRGRLEAINGSDVRPEDYENARKRRLAEREFNLSYGSRVPEGNVVVSGRWHGAETDPQFSVEQGLAETFALKLGDRVRFNVAGRSVEAPITSIRELEWDSMRVNFFFIASPGMLEGDPASLITSFRAPPGDQRFTAELVRLLPNLSVIDIDAVIAQVRSMTDKLVLIVEFVFVFALVAGFLVLFAALQATHDERDYELAMLRTLGASNRQVRQALLAEFAVLSVVACGLAAIGAGAGGWGIARYAFKMPYLPDVWQIALATFFGGAAVLAAGWFGTRTLLKRPPMASLRRLA
ncbi:MAG: putative ABC transport system permease protein [Azoarcus sp.]|uniref:Putative ABC transport system permease protein n=1 Tax=Aromatoleum tolulyticum TaxID=34027 RepID=A0A1N7CDQ3_9RHOO|nr:FtsX-like permease family protein [Aromatoleum tolulyticum]MCK9985060.1 putative ABC transport system permease protein [Azoarcus sp.]SIR61710.1 putative ABC transport system permease protein [Aromatoleum tolulyticum]